MKALPSAVLQHPELLPSHFIFAGSVEVRCFGDPFFYMINDSNVRDFHPAEPHWLQLQQIRLHIKVCT